MVNDAARAARPGRGGQLSALLQAAVADVAPHGRPARVLDCGGGTGSVAVPLAVAGADVTVLDISADALATLRRRADEAGVAALVHPVQGDVEAVAGLVEPDSADLVLAHGILEAVDDPPATLAGLAATVRPGGLVSLLVSNPAAAVLARALAGDPVEALRELRALAPAAEGARPTPARAEALCRDAGLTVESRHGVAVFTELVPSSMPDSPAARAALAELDAVAAEQAPFAELAGRVLLLARRPV